MLLARAKADSAAVAAVAADEVVAAVPLLSPRLAIIVARTVTSSPSARNGWRTCGPNNRAALVPRPVVAMLAAAVNQKPKPKAKPSPNSRANAIAASEKGTWPKTVTPRRTSMASP